MTIRFRVAYIDRPGKLLILQPETGQLRGELRYEGNDFPVLAGGLKAGDQIEVLMNFYKVAAVVGA